MPVGLNPAVPAATVTTTSWTFPRAGLIAVSTPRVSLAAGRRSAPAGATHTFRPGSQRFRLVRSLGEQRQPERGAVGLVHVPGQPFGFHPLLVDGQLLGLERVAALVVEEDLPADPALSLADAVRLGEQLVPDLDVGERRGHRPLPVPGVLVGFEHQPCLPDEALVGVGLGECRSFPRPGRSRRPSSTPCGRSGSSSRPGCTSATPTCRPRSRAAGRWPARRSGSPAGRRSAAWWSSSA